MSVLGVWRREAERSSSGHLPERILSLWGAAPISTPLRVGLCVALFAAIGALRVLFGGFPQNVYPHDLFIFLDGAWRVLHGQRPQVDFNSNLGPVMYVFTAIGLQLTHHAVHALAVAQTLFAGMAALLTAFIAFRRMSQVPALLITLCVELIAISPCNTGEEPFSITYAMLYNRVGFALLAVILIEATQRPRTHSSLEREEFIGGMISGFTAVFLFFLKFTYGLMALVLLVGLVPYRSSSRHRVVGFLIGLIASAIAFMAYLRFNVAAVLASLALGGAKQIVISDATSRITENAQNILLLVTLAALSAWVSGSLRRVDTVMTRAVRRAWAVGLACFAALGLLMTNAQREGLPLAALMCLIVASEMVALAYSAENQSHATAAASCLVLLGLLIPAANIVFWNGGAFAFSMMRASGFRSNAEELAIAAPDASDLRSKQKFLVGLEFEPYAQFINEGLALVAAHSIPTDTVTTLDFVNPFPFLLQLPPAMGGTTCLHYLTTFDEDHHLSPDQFLANSTLVMWPKSYEEGMLGRGIERVYATAVRERFTVVAESPMWRLLRRIPGH